MPCGNLLRICSLLNNGTYPLLLAKQRLLLYNTGRWCRQVLHHSSAP